MNLDPNGWGVRDAGALVRLIDQDLAAREADYPEAIRKGRMDQRSADARLAIVRDIRADLLFAFSPLGPSEIRFARPTPAIAWRSKVRWINHELDELQSDKVREAVRKGRRDGNATQAAISIMEQLKRLYWDRLFMWEPEQGSEAAAYLEQLGRIPAGNVERRRELSDGELGRAYRQTVREHLAAVELERDPTRQGELAA